ncbi:hypothetical protein HYV81_00690 [Candidatus Woesearchaeota archaeon]|nr:hypothetical protein [Candidatus Woesearchaeota archaeon]
MGARDVQEEIARVKEGLRQSFQRVKDDVAYQTWYIGQSSARMQQLESQFSKVIEELSTFNHALKEASVTNENILNAFTELKGQADALSQSFAELKQRDLGVVQEISAIKSGIQNVVIGLYEKLSGVESAVKEAEKAQEKHLAAVLDQIQGKLGQFEERSAHDRELLKAAVKEALRDMKPEQPRKESKLQAQLMKKIDKNRKNLIKQKIKDIVSVRSMSLPELKEIIVDENGYCSKATFYRYIDEMRDKKILSVIEIDNIKTISLQG